MSSGQPSAPKAREGGRALAARRLPQSSALLPPEGDAEAGAQRPPALYIRAGMPYTPPMFVAVACEFASDDHRKSAYDTLLQYGLQRVQKDAFESTTLSETVLG
ncbi:MAG: hypothetical protein IMZ69_04695, partial [Spirochaetes bacterium]|nr:hypothetical protein [Spirochaetota bacterium]